MVYNEKETKITQDLERALEETFELLEGGERKQAIYLLKKIVKKHPQHYLTLYAQGMAAAFNDKLNIAKKYLLASIEKYPRYGLSHYNLSNVYRQERNIQAAVSHAVLAIEYASEDELAAMQSAKDMISIAEAELAEGCDVMDFLNDFVVFNQGIASMETSAPQRAISLFEEVIAHQPRHTQAYNNLGHCHILLDNVDSAIACFQQALTIDPNYAIAKNNLRMLKGLNAGELQNIKSIIVNSNDTFSSGNILE